MAYDIKEAQARAMAMFVNFSDFLKKDVRDSDGKLLGNIWDVSLRLGEVYPKLEYVVIYKGFWKKLYSSVPFSSVTSIEDDLMVNMKFSDKSYAANPGSYEFLLKRDVLDQQVVDTYNHKVRRVNDIHLLKVDNEFVVAHVDIGLRGLMRRLGWEKITDLLVRIVNKKSKYLTREDLISWKYVQPVSLNPASMTMKLSVSEKQIQSIPTADLVDIIFDLNLNQRMALFRALDVKTKAKVFGGLEFEDQRAILKELDKKEAAQIVANMPSDDAADLLEKLPRGMVTNLLTLIESNMAKKLSTLLGYSGDSAGGIMTADYVSIQETMPVEGAIEHIKNNTREFDVVPYIYLVDEKNRLKGITTVRRLLFENPKEAALKTAFPKTFYVYLNNSLKEVAFLMEKYKLSTIAVIDENKILHGIITVDDILSRVIAIAWRKRQRMPKGV